MDTGSLFRRVSLGYSAKQIKILLRRVGSMFKEIFIALFFIGLYASSCNAGAVMPGAPTVCPAAVSGNEPAGAGEAETEEEEEPDCDE